MSVGIGDIKANRNGARSLALIMMLIASIIASFSGFLIRSMEAATPDQINIYRSIFFTAVIGVGYTIYTGRGLLGKLFHMPLPVYGAALCLGITGLLVPHALTMTTIANNAFAMSATPFITMALAYLFLGERISRRTFVTMVFATIGIILMIYDGLGSGNAVGNMLALLVAVGFSLFVVIVRGYRNIDMIPCLFIAGLIVIAGAATSNGDGYSIGMRDLLLCLVWGAVLSGIVHWIFVIAAKHLVASELTLFMLFEFALAPIWVWIFFSEEPEFLALVGGTIVIASVIIRTVLEKNQHSLET